MLRIGSVEAGKPPFLFDLLSSLTPNLKRKIKFTTTVHQIQQRNIELRFTHLSSNQNEFCLFMCLITGLSSEKFVKTNSKFVVAFGEPT